MIHLDSLGLNEIHSHLLCCAKIVVYVIYCICIVRSGNNNPNLESNSIIISSIPEDRHSFASESS